MRPDAKFICDGEWDMAQDSHDGYSYKDFCTDNETFGESEYRDERWKDWLHTLGYYAVRISIVTFILFLIWLWVTS
jgi:hypothetical protein